MKYNDSISVVIKIHQLCGQIVMDTTVRWFLFIYFLWTVRFKASQIHCCSSGSVRANLWIVGGFNCVKKNKPLSMKKKKEMAKVDRNSQGVE